MSVRSGVSILAILLLAMIRHFTIPVVLLILLLGFPAEMRQMFLGLYRHPEDMQKVMAEMQATFQKQLEARKKK